MSLGVPLRPLGGPLEACLGPLGGLLRGVVSFFATLEIHRLMRSKNAGLRRLAPASQQQEEGRTTTSKHAGNTRDEDVGVGELLWDPQASGPAAAKASSSPTSASRSASRRPSKSTIRAVRTKRLLRPYARSFATARRSISTTTAGGSAATRGAAPRQR